MQAPRRGMAGMGERENERENGRAWEAWGPGRPGGPGGPDASGAGENSGPAFSQCTCNCLRYAELAIAFGHWKQRGHIPDLPRLASPRHRHPSVPCDLVINTTQSLRHHTFPVTARSFAPQHIHRLSSSHHFIISSSHYAMISNRTAQSLRNTPPWADPGKGRS
jgi:hypothetical protein